MDIVLNVQGKFLRVWIKSPNTESIRRLLGGFVSSQEETSGFGEGPLEVDVTDLCVEGDLAPFVPILKTPEIRILMGSGHGKYRISCRMVMK